PLPRPGPIPPAWPGWSDLVLSVLNWRLPVLSLAAQGPEYVVASLAQQTAQGGGRVGGRDVLVRHPHRLFRDRARRIHAADQVLRHRRGPVLPDVPGHGEVLLPIR